jgi:hypothetical protein
MKALPKSFGYTLAFLEGKLGWDFTASSGGGRQTLDNIKDLAKELADFTIAGEDLETRQITLKSLFHGHYDQKRVVFLVHFLLDHVPCPPSISKEKAVDLLVENNIPFIPFSILQQHLTAGAKKFTSSKTFSALNLDPSYAAFLLLAPFGSKKPEMSEELKQDRLAAAVSYWEDAFTAVNRTLPANKKQGLSDAEIAKLSGSQFSVSAGGTPSIKDSFVRSPAERALRDKMIKAKCEYKRLQAAVLKNDEAQELTDQLMDSVSVPTGKIKRKRHASDSDNDSDQDHGTRAYDSFLKSFSRRVENYAYIDFSKVSANRLKAIKMLDSSAVKTTTLAVGLTFKHALSEADVAHLENDLLEITSGFTHHYLNVVSDSHLDAPLEIIKDRLAWWQWAATTFVGNAAAQVLFIKEFVFANHGKRLWLPQALTESIMVARCFRVCPDHPITTLVKNARPPPANPKVPRQQKQPLSVVRRAKLTPPQIKKMEEWKKRFPQTCLSRIVKGRQCNMEVRSQVCGFEHKCAWCHSATCKAECAQAETL